jgi:hypothetical protein
MICEGMYTHTLTHAYMCVHVHSCMCVCLFLMLCMNILLENYLKLKWETFRDELTHVSQMPSANKNYPNANYTVWNKKLFYLFPDHSDRLVPQNLQHYFIKNSYLHYFILRIITWKLWFTSESCSFFCVKLLQNGSFVFSRVSY